MSDFCGPVRPASTRPSPIEDIVGADAEMVRAGHAAHPISV